MFDHQTPQDRRCRGSCKLHQGERRQTHLGTEQAFSTTTFLTILESSSNVPSEFGGEMISKLESYSQPSDQETAFSNMQGLKRVTSHALFLRKLPWLCCTQTKEWSRKRKNWGKERICMRNEEIVSSGSRVLGLTWIAGKLVWRSNLLQVDGLSAVNGAVWLTLMDWNPEGQPLKGRQG